MSTLSTISSTTTGVSGILMAVPQLGSILGLSSSAANTIGYQPLAVSGQVNPPALLFHYEGEQNVFLDSDITDHWSENNTTIQDQVALKPVTITTHGFIGELTDAPANPALAALQVAANKLLLVEGLTPQLTLSAIEAYNTASQAYNQAATLANSAVSAFNSISPTGQTGEALISQSGITNVDLSSQGQQQKYFQQFYGYWNNRTLFTVQTPWAVFTNMAIKSLRAVQEADTNVITDFEITFKMMRFVSLGVPMQAIQGNSALPGSRLFSQTQSPTTSVTALSQQVAQPGF